MGHVATAKVDVEQGFEIEEATFLPIDDDLLLICEVHDPEVGAGIVTRLNKSLQPLWRLHFPAFNISVGVVEGSSLYLAGIGTVAAIDLHRGRYHWKHEGLYDQKRYSFNSFVVPEVDPAIVVFREDLTEAGAGPARVIRVTKQSGVLQVE